MAMTFQKRKVGEQRDKSKTAQSFSRVWQEQKVQRRVIGIRLERRVGPMVQEP